MTKHTAALADGLAVVYRPIDALIPYARNARTHSDAQVAQIAASLREFGWTNPVLVDGDGGIIAGHGRVLGARQLGLTQIPTISLAHLTETQRRAYVLADNKLAEAAGWDSELLALEVADLSTAGYDIRLLGFSADELETLLVGDAQQQEQPRGNLAAQFMIPPFSVLNAREGWWQERKRAWLALGIRSEVGRDAAPSGSKRVAKYVNGVRTTGLVTESDTSVFDPVLCELAYRWFCPPSGLVLDPFAGGSVRGIVAARLGLSYVGMDLRAAQVEANRVQASTILGVDEPAPCWIAGDSRGLDRACRDVDADLLFTCPPYADLEVYSDDPADLSTLSYTEFRSAYAQIIAKACARLKRDRFAAVVVGEVRGRDGAYYDFVGDTVQAFRDAGLAYYNEAILVTPAGSLPLRAGKAFATSRKLGKTHQNVLVFLKGDARRAIEACGPVVLDEGMFAEMESPDEAAPDGA